MARWLIGVAAIGLAAGGAGAQVPYEPAAPAQFAPTTLGPATYPPNYFANSYYRGTQPLSPYLNLIRGGNPGVNYYYGVRPGTPSGMPITGGFRPVAPEAVGPARSGFIPAASDPTQPPVTISADTMIPYIPPASHPVSFGGGVGRGAGMSTPSRSGFTGNRMPPSAPLRGRPGRN